jgi:hypothetical protein
MRALLTAGGGFATTVATILGLAGRYRLGDTVVLYALAAVCLIAALTLLTAASTLRRVSRPGESQQRRAVPVRRSRT